RAAPDRLRHPARRAVDRPAHQDRAVRPAAGDVRPQRRGAGADRRATQPGRLLLGGDRGGPDRPQVPHPPVPAFPRLPPPHLPRRGVARLPDITVEFATEPNHDGEFWPYLRDPETLARPWAIPGTPGLEHRIGGLEKAAKTGDISYAPANHEYMVRIRAERIESIPVPDIEIEDPDE